jgi:hypothetical protein
VETNLTFFCVLEGSQAAALAISFCSCVAGHVPHLGKDAGGVCGVLSDSKKVFLPGGSGKKRLQAYIGRAELFCRAKKTD